MDWDENCQYSHVTWIRRDSANFKALTSGLESRDPSSAITTFLDTLVSAHKEYQRDLRPGVDMTKLLGAYQDKTGIISTKSFTVPDVPDDPDHPGNSAFFTDLIEDIAGSLVSEIGTGITIYTLVLDLIAWFDIKLHIKGILLNNSKFDLNGIDLRFGPNGLPNLLPLSSTIPAVKQIMNPIDKKNYECAGFTLFGGVGVQSLEGFFMNLETEWRRDVRRMYFQYYTAGLKGVAEGDDQEHSPLVHVQPGPLLGVLVDRGMLDSVCLFAAR